MTAFRKSTAKMPVFFIGHGNPMNAIEDNEFSRTWADAVQSIPMPTAILCISAHWETTGTWSTGMMHPRTIHDFYGFPPELYRITYPAPGSPELALLVQKTVKTTRVILDHEWGFDHGAWSILRRMFPNADIPVVQLSLDRTKDPPYHYALGKALSSLRKMGILIVGSGNMVHNLGVISWEDMGYDWAMEFDDTLADLILAGDHDALIDYQKLGKIARLSIPTNEHYLPLLYALALQDNSDPIRFFSERVTLGSISMRSLRIG
jgi:4,5-DOPA dioxygenase extradiol